MKTRNLVSLIVVMAAAVFALGAFQYLKQPKSLAASPDKVESVQVVAQPATKVVRFLNLETALGYVEELGGVHNIRFYPCKTGESGESMSGLPMSALEVEKFFASLTAESPYCGAVFVAYDPATK